MAKPLSWTPAPPPSPTEPVVEEALEGRLQLDGRSLRKHTPRSARCAIAPTVPALAAVLALRLVDGSSRTLGRALAELALYLAVTVAATWLLERSLLREAVGYLRRSAPAVTA